MKRIYTYITLVAIILLTSCSSKNGSPETTKNVDNEEKIITELKQDTTYDDTTTIKRERILYENKYEPVKLFGEFIEVKSDNGELIWVYPTGEMIKDNFIDYSTIEEYRYFGNEKYAAVFYSDRIDIINEHGEVEYTERDIDNMELKRIVLYNDNPLLVFYKKIDSFEGNKETYYLIDEGTKKTYEFNADILLVGTYTENNVVFKEGNYVGNGVFITKQSVKGSWIYDLINIETGQKVELGEHIFYRGPYSQDGILSAIVGNGVQLYDEEGEIINTIPYLEKEDGKNVVGRFSEDLVFIENCFYDKNGNICIDLSQYQILKFGNVMGLLTEYDSHEGSAWPYFYNGYACLRMNNPDGDEYAAVIDKEGEFLFEPVKGSNISRIVKNNCIVVRTEDGFKLVDINGNVLWEKYGDFFVLGISDYYILVNNIDIDCIQVYDYDGNLLIQEIYYYND